MCGYVASSLVLAGLLFLVVFMLKRQRSKTKTTNLYADDGINNIKNNPGLQKNDDFERVGGIKGVIVDEQGLDVFYWKELQDYPTFEKQILKVKLQDYPTFEKQTLKVKLQDYPTFEKQILKAYENESRKSKVDIPIQEAPFLRGKSSNSHVWPVSDYKRSQSENLSDSLSVVNPLKPAKDQETTESQQPIQSPPPPAVPLSNAAVTAPPPPPPPVVVERKGRAPPPPPPPYVVRLKPLHWDKVNANVEHSMVWHKLQNGSFRVDDDLMESLFGTMTLDKKMPQVARNSPSPKAQMKSGPSRIFLLDTRKSQNIAIVVKSLAISSSKIIDFLHKGKGLDTETLEKLNRISPSKEDEQIILDFEGDVTRLADAESFLYHILKAIPSAFTRVNVMLFKSNYRSEVAEVKKSLQTLEMACKELKTRGLFVKLLEAILKAGNRMNVGTSRGNAQAFNLNSLLKLSDVKSSDGKTTLLHFVVEEVVRAEGKRCNINRNHSKSTRTSGLNSVTVTEDYYIKLGLPVVGGVSSEFINVKKAAGIDYDVFSKSCSGLSGHLAEITKSIKEFGEDERGGFVGEMTAFLEGAEKEIGMLREEEGKIMGLVKITNEYYQAGTSKDVGAKQFQLFGIIRGFLEMVDKACVDIAIKMQKRRTGGGSPDAVFQMSKSPDRPSVRNVYLCESCRLVVPVLEASCFN
ncbi:Actin-binding FH2 [Artemisia annua]|uniref:Formin-like protein n=1 Tax=Artemisia annua TaxID=35608 RepID=A0A2U1MM92_ARTAN|nr:Actin-binding FH2 [Artemisia annua]